MWRLLTAERRSCGEALIKKMVIAAPENLQGSFGRQPLTGKAAPRSIPPKTRSSILFFVASFEALAITMAWQRQCQIGLSSARKCGISCHQNSKTSSRGTQSLRTSSRTATRHLTMRKSSSSGLFASQSTLFLLEEFAMRAAMPNPSITRNAPQAAYLKR